MSKNKLLSLAAVGVAISEFYTDLDNEVSMEVLKVCDDGSSIIVASNKLTESHNFNGIFYADDNIFEAKFIVIARMNDGMHLRLKLDGDINPITVTDFVNTYGGLSVEVPIPSMLADDTPLFPDTTLRYRCYGIFKNAVILECGEQHLLQNLTDCIESKAKIAIQFLNENGTKTCGKSLKKINHNMVKLDLDCTLQPKEIRQSQQQQIEFALDSIVEINAQKIQEISCLKP